MAEQRQDDTLGAAVIAHYEVPPVSQAVEDRVFAALREADASARTAATSERRSWLAIGALITGVAASAAVTLSIVRDRTSIATRGEVTAAERATIRLGRRGVAVAETGASLSWSIDGAARVDQRTGNVFYRVDHGDPFVVSTPAGTVTVLGTSFRVEVEAMKSPNKLALTGAAGAALGAAVIVTLYEGGVVLANERGSVTMKPGEQAVARSGSMPSVSPAPGTGSLANAASANAYLEAENRRLRERIARLQGDAPPADGASGSGSAGIDDQRMPIPFKTFENEDRDEVWAPGQEARIRERLSRFVKLGADDARIECRTSCCQVKLDVVQLRSVSDEIQSDVGMGPLFATWQINTTAPDDDDLGVVTACSPNGLMSLRNPDRGVEREELLERARPALAACARQLAGPLRGTVTLSVENDGSVSDVQSHFEPIGNPVAECAQEAITSAATFKPSSKPTRVPIRIDLSPTK